LSRAVVNWRGDFPNGSLFRQAGKQLKHAKHKRTSTHNYANIFTSTHFCDILLATLSRGVTVTPSSKKITVLLDESCFRRFDQFCQEKGFKKSTLLARLIREFMERETLEDTTFLKKRSSEALAKKQPHVAEKFTR
jgi:hypothetical protein